MLREVKLKEEEQPWLQYVKYGQTYGIPNRIIAIVAGCFSLYCFSHVIFPSADPISLYASPNTLITSSDFLNASASDPPPFAFCPVFGPGDAIAEKRGQWGLLRSRLHMGTGARVQKVVQKAMAGAPITISVLGGSISACHGAGDNVVSPTCYPSRIFDWWNSVFPHPSSELTNGAVRRADSSYFSYCSMHHLPDETDLIILEFDASDPNDPVWLSHFELLVRSLLVRADEPAVIILGHFSPQIHSQNGFAGPELLHTVVAQFYDVPHISVKGLIYNPYMSDPEGQRKLYYADPVLANKEGHQLIADVVTSYLQSQICAGWAAMMGHGFDVPYLGNKGVAMNDEEARELEHKKRHTNVPQAMLSDRPSDILKFREVEPFCVTANDILNPLPPSQFSDGSWMAYHPKSGKQSSDEEKHYWYAEEAGARLRIPITLSAGDVTIHYIQTPSEEPMGSVECWVDDNVGNAMELQGNADVHGMTETLTKIDSGVSSGAHYVECVLLGDEGDVTPPFKILGILPG